jgi:ABC-2 type transport system permease protein
MWAEFKHTLRRMRWQIGGWSLGIALYILLMVFFHPSMADMGEMLDQYLSMFPEAMLAFFENISAINTPMGYLDVYFFSYMHLIIGILAISGAVNLLVGDEEKGLLDLVLAQPVSRTSLFYGRLLALLTALVMILFVGWLSWVIPAGRVGFALTWSQLLRPFISLFAVLMLFAALALLFSLILPAARLANLLTGALLVGNFLLMGLANLNENLRQVMNYTPLHYYQGGTAVEGINGRWLFALLAAALLIIGTAWLLFLRRDIRVGGERSWKLSALWLRSHA